jgi:nicotinamidase-related amidase
MPSDADNDLHGNVPDHASTCLLIIDMINPLTFEGAEQMLPAVSAAAERIALLKKRIKADRVPVLYVNDNFGKWQSDFRKLVHRCLEGSCRGKWIAQLLHPQDDDYFVLKPKHSGFYRTPLELLLQFLGTKQLICTGIAGNSCVLYTAADAHMRDFDLIVPADCVASTSSEENQIALQHMHRMLKADIRSSEELTWPPTPATHSR